MPNQSASAIAPSSHAALHTATGDQQPPNKKYGNHKKMRKRERERGCIDCININKERVASRNKTTKVEEEQA